MDIGPDEIIDAHLHLYDPARVDLPWLKDVPKLQGRHMIEEWDVARGALPVTHAVFCEVNAGLPRQMAEARLIAETAKTHPAVCGMVVAAPMDRGEQTAEHLDAVAALDGVRGVRHLLEEHAHEPGWALRPVFVEGVRSLATQGLTFDICLRQSQLAEAAQLVSLCPDVTFVLDHMGKPDIRDGALDEWLEAFALIAAHDNVICKVSGIVTEADHQRWRADDLIWCIRQGIRLFGYDRLMFGSDWPVLDLASDYVQWLTIVEDAIGDASGTERHALFRRTAQATYGLN